MTFWNALIRAKHDGVEDLPPESRWSLMSRVRAGCFALVGVGTAVALTVVAVFANAGLHFLPLPALPVPGGSSAPGIGSGTAVSLAQPSSLGQAGSGGVGPSLAVAGSSPAVQVIVDSNLASYAPAETEGTSAPHVSGSAAIGGGESISSETKGAGGQVSTPESSSPETEATAAPTTEVAATTTTTEEALATGSTGSSSGSSSTTGGETPVTSVANGPGGRGQGSPGEEGIGSEAGGSEEEGSGEETPTEESPESSEGESTPVGPSESETEVETETTESPEGEPVGPLGGSESTSAPAVEEAATSEEAAPAEEVAAEAGEPAGE
ncbi:MAG: hypothetical protein QM729_14390 [Solirubrobacterales bacterium]